MDSEATELESTPVTEAPTETVAAVAKKPRSEAQMAALEAARKKALELRAQKSAEKTQKPAVAPEPEEEQIEYVKKHRSKPKPKKKRVIVVEESSSSDSEIEVRLPKRREPRQQDVRFEQAYSKMFSM